MTLIKALAIVGVLVAPATAVAQTVCVAPDLDQGWSTADRDQFWFLSQGSRLMPYRWLEKLEDPAVPIPGSFKDTLEGLGFIPAPKSTANPGGLPVGFAPDGTGAQAAVGLTCSACHSRRMSLGGARVIVEGGPTQADFETFVRRLQDAVAQSSAGPRFDRFHVSVLGPDAPAAAIAKLKTDMIAFANALDTQWIKFFPAFAAGHGRVDAFGLIFNRVAAFDICAAANARVADAPVSYPFLWNTPQHDRVQWNGSASNGPLGVGPLIRNVGEVLGVFGELLNSYEGVPAETAEFPFYPSSIRLRNLGTLEELLKDLRPPAWPENCSPVDKALVAKGKALYDKTCEKCHELIDRTDLTTEFKAKMKSVAEVGTDPAMATNHVRNFKQSSLETGLLIGRWKWPIPLSKFKSHAEGSEILAHAILGAVLGRGADAAAMGTLGPQLQAIRYVKKVIEPKKEYKARPLNGIWATAPYLHNGSVPNLAELLMPVDTRPKTFRVGSEVFDFNHVGLPANAATGTLIDTTIPGNKNTGHAYGVTLSPADKKALLEFLKVIGEKTP